MVQVRTSWTRCDPFLSYSLWEFTPIRLSSIVITQTTVPVRGTVVNQSTMTGRILMATAISGHAGCGMRRDVRYELSEG